MMVMNKLILQRTPEAFHAYIVKAVASSAHRRLYIELTSICRYLPVFIRAILAIPVRVMDYSNQPEMSRARIRNKLI
jgi:hypothetical protein